VSAADEFVSEDRDVAEQRRAAWTWVDVIRSMAILVVLALVLAGFAALKRGEHDPVREITYERELEGARLKAGYAVLAPVGLDDGWRATSVRLTDEGDGKTLWHMGWLSPDETYVGLEQTDDGRDDLLDQLFHDTRPDGTSRIGGQHWERLREVGDDPADYALVRTDNGVTTVVLGRGGYAQLEAFAQTLQTG
jgi:Protein of unknown function (DUF4245)